MKGVFILALATFVNGGLCYLAVQAVKADQEPAKQCLVEAPDFAAPAGPDED